MNKKIRIGVFPDGVVGSKVISFLLENYFNDIQWVVCNNQETIILEILKRSNFESNNIFLNSQLNEISTIETIINSKVDYILLSWWPHIIKEPFLSLPRIGVLNFHPSLLPFNRGKHYNFWTIVEDTPFGVSIHFANKTIDGGDIIFQKKIEKEWQDTGETIYYKAQNAMVELFIDSYSKIREKKYTRIQQDLSIGTLHYAKELEPASKIILDKEYKARELINVMRARTFLPHPGSWFEEDGVRYEIHINITKVK